MAYMLLAFLVLAHCAYGFGAGNVSQIRDSTVFH